MNNEELKLHLEQIQNIETDIKTLESLIREKHQALKQAKKDYKNYQKKQWPVVQKKSVREIVSFLGVYLDARCTLYPNFNLTYHCIVMHINPEGDYQFYGYDPKKNLRDVSLEQILKDLEEAWKYVRVG